MSFRESKGEKYINKLINIKLVITNKKRKTEPFNQYPRFIERKQFLYRQENIIKTFHSHADLCALLKIESSHAAHDDDDNDNFI